MTLGVIAFLDLVWEEMESSGLVQSLLSLGMSILEEIVLSGPALGAEFTQDLAS